jgi:hypothetical protein
MIRHATPILLAACILCLAIGCVARDQDNGSAPAPANQPNEPETPWVDEQGNPVSVDEVHRAMAGWLAENPMRSRMRSMWVSSGEIVSVASGAQGVIDFDTLESNAENIARKAGGFAAMWELIRDANREMAAKAGESEWFEARYQSQRLWKACTDCHVETWSLETRGFMPETIDAWLENGNTVDAAPYGNLRLSSTPQFLQLMFRMVALLDRAVTAIDGNDSRVVLDNARAIHQLVNEQLELWRSVERHARRIAELASRNDTLGVDRQYSRMIANCGECHEKFVQDERLPLNPLPWKYRNE